MIPKFNLWPLMKAGVVLSIGASLLDSSVNLISSGIESLANVVTFKESKAERRARKREEKE